MIAIIETDLRELIPEGAIIGIPELELTHFSTYSQSRWYAVIPGRKIYDPPRPALQPPPDTIKFLAKKRHDVVIKYDGSNDSILIDPALPVKQQLQ
jgi:hypothetical protein